MSVEEPAPTGAAIKIFPNPAGSIISLEIPHGNVPAKLTVMNLSGLVVLTRKITGSKSQVDIGTLPAGVYFVRLTGKKSVQVGKFIRQ